MQLPLSVNFVDREFERQVEGAVCIADERHLLSWTGWRYRPDDEDRKWDWWGIFRDCGFSGGRCECYAALAADDLQGLMALDLADKAFGPEKGIIIDYLATNPANRESGRGLKFVGIALMVVAIGRSAASGLGGQIWLESLPGAARFYESLGMVRQPQRSADGNIVYMLDPASAEQLLAEITRRGIIKS